MSDLARKKVRSEDMERLAEAAAVSSRPQLDNGESERLQLVTYPWRLWVLGGAVTAVSCFLLYNVVAGTFGELFNGHKVRSPLFRQSQPSRTH